MPRLTRRERFLATAVTAVVVVWTIHGAVIKPARDRVRTLERVIPEKLGELAELRAGIIEYNALRRKVERIEAGIAAQNPDFHLPTHIETLLDAEGLSGHLVTMTPNDLQLRSGYAETVVEIKLEALQLAQIVGFMAAVETHEPLVRIGSLSIRSQPDANGKLEATLVIHSPLPVETVAVTGAAARS
jgi:hypothetical protein